MAIAKAAGLLGRAAKKSRAERFASRLGLRVRRPVAFQPSVQGKIRHIPGETTVGKRAGSDLRNVFVWHDKLANRVGRYLFGRNKMSRVEELAQQSEAYGADFGAGNVG